MKKIIFKLSNEDKIFSIPENSNSIYLARSINLNNEEILKKWSLRGSKTDNIIEEFLQEVISSISDENIIEKVIISIDENTLFEYSLQDLKNISYNLDYDDNDEIRYDLLIEFK